ncbi:DUF4139 domain-containing protein [Croceicoccus mobilis]|uniref:DUF4139 domain-containing protein n=1 Tax=Croceicoccus mobilis TaxID=1703339 RepID=A0A916Z7H6_9SPHN|nr:hypothetical protein [Croceicoccus mobilis]GGD79695.1 hypothetical protein GCM10010990_32020 [Croceicoccus mobilis]
MLQRIFRPGLHLAALLGVGAWIAGVVPRPGPADAQEMARAAVDASAPTDIAVTIYRDEDRMGGPIDPDWAGGFAMISETRTVTLPAGPSRVRFEGVAESMVAVSAIVTGLPGGTIEKNRNAAVLSPASLVDGTLGNRVTITRTNPGTGEAVSESAVVKTRADGGLVLKTRDGYEAVRCAGLPEKLTFDRVPAGLSPQPVYSVDTVSPRGGTYTVTLTYLATDFDWQANYVATFDRASREKERTLKLMAWLTVANSNGQSFPGAELMTVAGRVNVTSDYEQLADAPDAKPLRLTCYPLGSTATGTQPTVYDDGGGLRVPPPAPAAMMAESIVVTAQRKSANGFAMDEVADMEASEEALGDLKLYRVPVPVDVSAQGQKQVKFLDLGAVKGRMVHFATCDREAETPAMLRLEAKNLEANGLGRALPEGQVAVFEPSRFGPLLVAEDQMRDFATGEDVEIMLALQTPVLVDCRPVGDDREEAMERFDELLAAGKWASQEAVITNPTASAISFQLVLSPASVVEIRRASRKIETYRGNQAMRIDVPAGSSRTIRWQMRDPSAQR